MNNNILLMGPPNVGKSVFFGHLTGLDVTVSNYPGTTVDYKKGKFQLQGEEYTLIDVPGVYSLDAASEAERIAVKLLSEDPRVVICILDAVNFESSIHLLLQVLERGIPVIAVVNRMDLAREKGKEIDTELLSRKLKIPVISAVAVLKKGVKELKYHLSGMALTVVERAAQQSAVQLEKLMEGDLSSADGRWDLSEKLAREISVRKESDGFSRDISKRELWGEKLVKPWPGLPLAILILGLVFGAVVGIGMGLRQYLLLPFFRGLIFPRITDTVIAVVPPGVFRDILIGEYGFLIKGLEWPFALVFPYVISFYSALSVLEDTGYLPRLGILLDGMLNKLGLGGSGIIPLLLGYGCAIPGITATRALNSTKERIIVSSVICLSVPCVAQSGAFISLLAERSILIVLALFLFSIIFMIQSALLLNLFVPGQRPETVMEVPELLWPRPTILGKKIWVRIKNFLVSGELPMIYAIGLAAILYETGVLIVVGRLMQPLVTGWLRLPAEASTPLILGIIRRELTVLPLLEMELTGLQLFVAALVGLFYVPCIAVLSVLNSEFNIKIMAVVLLLTTSVSFFLGGIISRLGGLFF